MTETREVSRDDYRAIADAQHELHSLINAAMEQLAPGPDLTDEWHQLHAMMQAASIIGALASEGIRHAPDPDAPVPYTVAGLDAIKEAGYAAWTARHVRPIGFGQ